MKFLSLILKKSLQSTLFISITTVSLLSTATEFTYTENDNTGNNIAIGFEVPLPVDSLTPVDGFRSYASLHARHQQLDAQSSMINAFNIGTTFNSQTIWAYQLSDADNLTISGATEGSALINGGIHAREWQSPEAVTGYIENLFNNADNQHLEQYILENINLMVIPVLNIDGFMQTQRFPNKVTDEASYPRDGRMRRKNMHGVDQDLSTIGDNLRGIDLNRNSNSYWATDSERSSGDPDSIVHHGASAASEPETQTLQAAAVQVGESRLRFYTDTHSFSQVYFTPMTSNERRNTVTNNIATIMRGANNYKYRYGPSPAGSGIGATDEYFANTYQIPSYTLEIEPLNSASDYGGFGISHDGFILPNSEVSRMRAETSKATFAGLYAMAEVPMVQEIKVYDGSTLTSDNLVFHQKWRIENSVRVVEAIINTALVAGKDYQLVVVFNKPMRAIENEQAVAFSNLSLANQLNANLQIKTATSDDLVSIDTIQGIWLTTGFSRYKTDSYQTKFSLPAGFDWSATSLFSFQIETNDMTGQKLDTNPATIADWQNGAWAGYENTEGKLVDTGGIDKSMRLIDDGSDLYTVTPAPLPTPLPTPQPTSSNSGGGTTSLLSLLMLLCFLGQRWFLSVKCIS